MIIYQIDQRRKYFTSHLTYSILRQIYPMHSLKRQTINIDSLDEESLSLYRFTNTMQGRNVTLKREKPQRFVNRVVWEWHSPEATLDKGNYHLQGDHKS